MKIPWRQLRLCGNGSKGSLLVDPEDALDDLASFRKNRAWPKKPNANFLKNGYSWEDPSDPYTWGPKDPLRDVEWEGFEKALAKWKARPA